MGKKSTAQPRPQLHVPPRGIGPIQEPNENDVLCGRGGRINAHEGNVQFREVVNANKKQYLAKTTKKLEKAHIAAGLVEQIRSMNPPGRFLKEDADTGLWFDIGDAKAIKKAGQALREDAPDIREDDSDDDDDNEKPKPKNPTRVTHSPTVESGFPIVSPSAAVEDSFNHTRPVYSQHDMAPFPAPSAPSSAPPADMPGYQPPPLEYPTQWMYNDPYAAPPPQQQQRVAPNPLRNVPRQLYDGVRSVTKGAGSVSKKALDALNPGHDHPSESHYPDPNMAFGRVFNPTVDVSGGSDVMSGMSSISQNTSHMPNKSEVSALTMGSMPSSRFGAVQHGGGDQHWTAREDMQCASGPPQVGRQFQSGSSRSGLDNSTPVHERSPSNVSNLTYTFMQMSGMTRSPSFGEQSTAGSSARGDVPISDASLAALMDEEREVGAMYCGGQTTWDQSKKVPPSVSNPCASEYRASAGQPRNRVYSTSAMSITSMGSGVSDKSRLQPYRKKVASTVAGEKNPWDDDR
jgi:hypothetical protein